jgi:uncharacterized protein YjbI with pentapeptide repeats
VEPTSSTAGERWGDPITPERADKLKALANQQRAWAADPDHQGRKSYFHRVMLKGSDVFWLAAYELAGPDGDVAAAQEKLRTDVFDLIDLPALHLEGIVLIKAHLEGAILFGAHLEGALLGEAHLEGADLRWVHLEGAILVSAHLEGAILIDAHLEGKTYASGQADRPRIQQSAPNFPANLPPTDLRGAFLGDATALDDIHLGDAKGGTVQIADVRWGGVNLAVVDWTPFTDGKAVLGDEQAARDWKAEPFIETEGERKQTRGERAAQRAQQQLALLPAAVRANRQLATALRDQGMNEEADHFAYRAQVVQRQVFHLQGKRFRAGFSRFLDLLAGYGYVPQRSLIWYVVTVLGFAALYLVFAHLPPQEALVLSVTSFHGRGFPGNLSLHDPIMVVAAAEAMFGLLIEISFIATFTQRFFAR